MPDGLTLYLLDYILDEYFGGTGMTLQSLKAFMGVLNVPILYTGDAMYVEAVNFSLALRSALRIGQKAFLAPGCKPLARGVAVENSTRDLDPVYVKEVWKKVLAEMLLSKNWKDKAQARRIKADLETLLGHARHIALTPEISGRARKRQDKKNLAELDARGLDTDGIL